jgi:hypothetical protein
MSLLRICAEPGCGTRTLGRFCIDHELVRTRAVRRRGTTTPGALVRRAATPFVGTASAGVDEQGRR